MRLLSPVAYATETSKETDLGPYNLVRGSSSTPPCSAPTKY
jgi:hypothetical protein